MNKKILTTLVFLTLAGGVFFYPEEAEAINWPFAGRVATPLPIACPGGLEAFMISPVSFSPPGPYFISAATKRYQYWTATPGRVIIGLYSSVPVMCVTGTPPATVPVLRVIFFGTSLF